MNVKRFTARTSREALALVKQAFGDDAVVLSTRHGTADGVEVLAMAPDGMQQIEKAGEAAPTVRAVAPAAPKAAPKAAPANVPVPRPEVAAATTPRHIEPHFDAPTDPGVERDIETLGMSTLTFQDYVRERMLKRRQAELDQAAVSRAPAAAPADNGPVVDIAARRAAAPTAHPSQAAPQQQQQAQAAPVRRDPPVRREPPVLRDEVRTLPMAIAPMLDSATAQRERAEMMGELRSVKSLIEERFGMLAFMEKLGRQPRQAELAQKLLDTGFSPALIRKILQNLPETVTDEIAWAAGVLERNVLTDEHEAALEDVGGVFALIGSTGVGKTTSTAKLAAAFAAKHGAGNLGLITLDAYRIGAHEQLRTYGRILGVPVHTAHDRASLEDLLELLAAKKMVLIDTAGIAQRDSRTRELLDMLSHPSIQKLLVINAAAQGETVEDVLTAYGVASCRGVIVSKLDEAVKLAPALDALIRHKCKVVGVANGQRVPEDWHRLSAQALVQRALRAAPAASWRLESAEVNLVFAGRHALGRGAALNA
ncbi:MAG: flagellar biosynthesis protein FlhF [Burkholderiales bacterium]|nr:flagellar biosynthesis protein FlhF [Burkholderiales bacterium]